MLALLKILKRWFVVTNNQELLNNKWNGLRKELKNERIVFDDEFRKNNKEHECETKVYSWNGEWFCSHMTQARFNKFRKKINAEDNIVIQLSSNLILKNQKI